MKAEIIAVGSELLTPDFQDTNSLYLTAGLDTLGIAVAFKTIVGDEERDLARALRTALGRADVVLCMGGLGPTEDDRTRETLAKVLGRRLVFRAAIRERIRARFRRRGWPMTSSNLKQCYVIEGAEVLENPNGTAPGQWLEAGRRRVALLPGPPREIKPMFDGLVLPRLAGLGRGFAARRVLRLTGLGESAMENLLRPVYRTVPEGVTVTTLAGPGELSIHLTFRGGPDRAAAEARLDGLEAAVGRVLGPWIYSRDGSGLETVVGSLLRERGATLACAESCTGGLIGHRLTEVAGSSAYFLESAVVYANRAKVRRLGVPARLIERHGAVSAPVARAMAAGVRKTAGADYGLAVTGVAGPGGGTARKPVGLVHFALAHARGTAVERHIFAGGRSAIKFQASQKALDMLRKALINGAPKAV
ncbi:MAG: competence/damage-inducible protein A [Candidatus Aminicenantes bacterium]|nr:competence/damage-inducible protein A [Candidatus Aminicenantes bacterium]NLH75961.1 competence/damage-inducible protein A [Acidobacteriota bacterium]